jgi:hypothetical protein
LDNNVFDSIDARCNHEVEMNYPCPVTAQIEEVTHGFFFRQGDQDVANAKTKYTRNYQTWSRFASVLGEHP